jgi:hypothetical protein
MLKALCSCVLLLLAACATPTELRERPADLQLQSPKAPRDFVACVSMEWERKFVPVSTGLLPDGYTVTIVHSLAGADAVAHVTASKGGSNIKYAERLPSLSPEWMKAAVVNCI